MTQRWFGQLAFFRLFPPLHQSCTEIPILYYRPKIPKLDLDPTSATVTRQDLDNFLKSQKYPIGTIEDDVVDENGDIFDCSTLIESTSNENSTAENAIETKQNSVESVPKPVSKKSGKIATKWLSINEDQNDELEANKEKWSGVYDKKHHEETIPTKILRSGDPLVVPFRSEEQAEKKAIEDLKRLRHRSEEDSGFESSDVQNPSDAHGKSFFDFPLILTFRAITKRHTFKISRLLNGLKAIAVKMAGIFFFFP